MRVDSSVTRSGPIGVDPIPDSNNGNKDVWLNLLTDKTASPPRADQKSVVLRGVRRCSNVSQEKSHSVPINSHNTSGGCCPETRSEPSSRRSINGRALPIEPTVTRPPVEDDASAGAWGWLQPSTTMLTTRPTGIRTTHLSPETPTKPTESRRSKRVIDRPMNRSGVPTGLPLDPKAAPRPPATRPADPLEPPRCGPSVHPKAPTQAR